MMHPLRTRQALDRCRKLRYMTTQKGEESNMQGKALAVGSVGGILGSVAGMGGGFVMVPLMTSFLRLSQHQAHGTSLFAVAATGLAGAMSYSGEVQWDSAAAIAMSGMITARLGASATTKLSGVALEKAFGVFVLCVAPLVPVKGYLAKQAEAKQEEATTDDDDNSDKEVSRVGKLIVPSIIGLGSGFLAGLFGVGGGVIVVPALTVATDMNHYQALGTSLCAMTLPAIVGTSAHYAKGNVAIRAAPGLALGAFVGAYLGGQAGQKMNEDVLRYGFSALMIGLGVRSLAIRRRP